jgi:hypothetical protein
MTEGHWRPSKGNTNKKETRGEEEGNSGGDAGTVRRGSAGQAKKLPGLEGERT